MRTAAWMVGAVLAVAACGGSSAGTPQGTAPTGTPEPALTEAPVTASPGTTETAASLAPGSIAYRVVNLTAKPVDVYVRTQGLVQAFAATTGVAPGTVTEDLFPPEPGTVVVLSAGGADPACVIDCTFLAESSTNFGDGDRRLLVVRDGGATEYWEHPAAASVGASSNALVPTDPAQALLIIEAQGVTDASFGLQVAYAGTAGCRSDTTAGPFLLGGTMVLAYTLDPAGAQVTLHDNNDRDCSGTAVGGPFAVQTAVGSRTFLLLWGTKGAMQGLPVPLP